MKIIDSKPYPPKSKGLDCYTHALNAMIEHLEHPEIALLWKQCGLKYIRNTSHIIGKLDPNHSDRITELKLVSDVILEHKEFDDFELCMEYIKEKVSNDTIVAVRLDPFHLSFSIHYNNGHYNHVVRVLDIKDDEVLIVDDYYKFKGYVPINEFRKAVNYTYGFKEKIHVRNSIFYVKNKEFFLNHEDFKEVISKNVAALSDSNSSSNEKIIGISSINEFIKDCIKYSETEEICKEFMTSLYFMIETLANSRYSFLDFLRIYEKEHKLDRLIDALSETAQAWKVIANMTLKGIHHRHHEMFTRMLNKVEQVIEFEKKSYSELCQVLKCLDV